MDNRGLDKKGFENVDNDVTDKVFEDFNADETEFNKGEAIQSDGVGFVMEESDGDGFELGGHDEIMTMPPDTVGDDSVSGETDDFEVDEDNKLSGDAVKKIIRIVEKHDDNPALLNDEIERIGKKIRGIR